MSLNAQMAGNVISDQATTREWLGLVILALPCLLYSMDLTVLNLAVPHITADLAPTGPQLLWIIDIYGFFLAGALVTMGAVGDRIGRRKLLLIGAVAFGAASAMAAYANSVAMLILARALLGLAAATLAPSTLSLIRTMFRDDGQRSFAIGVWMASFSLGGAIGPLVGGALLEQFWWGSVFLISLPVMLLLLVAGPIVLPEHRDPDASRIDLASAGLSVLAMLALVFGVKHLAAGDLDWTTLAAILVGLVLGGIFLRRQGHLPAPLIDLSLFGSRGFSGSLVVNLTGFFVAFSTLLFLSQHLQLVLGMGPFQAGLWTLLSAAGFVSGALLSPILLKRIGAGKTMSVSALVAAIGFTGLALALLNGSFALLMATSFAFSIGLSPLFTLSADTIVGSAPERKAGAAAAIAETSSELGGALGIAVMGSIVAAIYRSQMSAIDMTGMSEEQSEAAIDSIGSAAAASSALGSEIAGIIAAASKLAFVQAFSAAAILAAVLCALTAIIAVRLRQAT